jgi:glutamine---fructose-6-phosphate transaminase (isomerizing)
MCGIVGVVFRDHVKSELIRSLKNLEYRGYDSAGLAILNQDSGIPKTIECYKAVGKLASLEKRLPEECLGYTGIGHTRWATHGAPTDHNAHPHSDGHVAVVHNGIIDNFQNLKEGLVQEGYVFQSDTDTEVVVHLFSKLLKSGMDLLEATQSLYKTLQGDFAIAMLTTHGPDRIIVMRKGNSPLAIGYDERGMSVSSDALGLQHLADRIYYMEDQTIAFVYHDHVDFWDSCGNPLVPQKFYTNPFKEQILHRGDYEHYMLKEIYEQPSILQAQVDSFFRGSRNFPKLEGNCLTITACGTAYYGGCIGRHFFEKLAQKSVMMELASEFYYRQPPLQGPVVVVSQSGETIDSLKALEYANSQDVPTYAIVNVPQSSISRRAGCTIYTHAGVEVGVASTKAFTAQILSCLLWALSLSSKNAEEFPKEFLRKELGELASKMSEVLSMDLEYRAIAKDLAKASSIFFLGRGLSYPLALEGALKMKELSYIHAEGFAAGEMKHGPLALLDAHRPVVFIAPSDPWFARSLSNIQEVSARGAPMTVLTDARGAESIRSLPHVSVLVLPDVDDLLTPFLYVLPLQLLAYYTAMEKGCDIDQPRNLAKSVTVE